VVTASVADRSRPASRGGVDRARRLAFDVLRAVHAEEAYANLELARRLGERRLDGRDAAFATELVAGTCRGQGTYDQILVAASGRSLTSLQPAVVDLLRLGAHQLLGMRVPSHAAVAATVALAGQTVGQRVRGLVNAVLRRVAERDLDGWLETLGEGLEERERLALRHAHPRWVVDAFAEVLPENELAAALAADNQPPAVTLAVRPGLGEVEELTAAGARPGRHSPYAAEWSGNPADLPAVREGRAGIQDEGSQLVALGLNRLQAPPGWWLDLCAGPGGKSALLAGLARFDGSRLLCCEISPHRAALVTAAIRAYRPRPPVVIADGTRPAWPPGRFRRVLADVPCTGLGALRRRPDVRWRRRPADIVELAALQRALLRAALSSAAPGGVVAYVTCSPIRAETSEVVQDVLRDRPEVRIEPAAPLFPELSGATRGPYLQLWPHRHGTDAMFAAYLRVGSGTG
jgi:16S rRNA (cytosine967-C5)-methyltransferase